MVGVCFLIMLHLLRPTPGSTRKRKRVARGNSGSGGTTAGRGTKGQQSRTGKGRSYGFEGGQTPLLRRQPKLGGFKRPRRVPYEALALAALEKRLEAGTYTLTDLRSRRLIRPNSRVKLLGNAGITKKFSVEVHAASRGAKKAIEGAGGKVTIVR